MSAEWVHPTSETIKAIHRKVLEAHGGGTGLRDEKLLDSAVSAPQATLDGKPLLEDGVEVASAYLFYLCRNHPFIDGNKRTALATCLIFLTRNGLLGEGPLPVDAWESLVIDIAASRLDREQTTARLRRLIGEKGRKK